MVEGRGILLRKIVDKYCALDDRCTHREGPLSEGTLEGGIVTCPWHFGIVTCPWHFGQFDLETGEVRGPTTEESLRTYELRVDGTNIVISIAERTLPDPTGRLRT